MSEVREWIDEERRVWTITDSVWRRIGQDLQSIVNCTLLGDVLSLGVSETISPERSIIIPWNLTVTSSVSRPTVEVGTFRRAQTRTSFTCSPGQGIFSIQSPDVVLANLEFKDCRQRLRGVPALIEIEACREDDTEHIIQLHHTHFRNNSYKNGTLGLFVDRPSCAEIEMRDVHFEKNRIATGHNAVLGKRNRLVDVSATRNRQTSLAPSSDSAVFLIEDNDNTAVSGMRAVRNSGSVIRCKGGSLTVSDSVFVHNVGGRTLNWETFAGGLTLVNLTDGRVFETHFENNSADAGAGVAVMNSHFTFSRSNFTHNRAQVGAGIFIVDESEVEIEECRFTENTVEENGAAVLANGTSTLSTRDSTFERNNATEHGAVFVFNSDLYSANDTFRENVAVMGGAAITVRHRQARIRRSSFMRNSVSDGNGGAIHAEETHITVTGITCEQNHAHLSGTVYAGDKSTLNVNSALFLNNTANGGAAIAFASNNDFNCIDSTFEQNSVENGGGGAIETLNRGRYRVQNCTFNWNSATHGGGIKIASESNLTCIGNTFEGNNATDSGGALYLGTGSQVTIEATTITESYARFAGGIRGESFFTVTIRDSTISSNWVNENDGRNGGGLYVDKNAEIQMVRVNFTDNRAGYGGGIFVSSGNRLTLETCLFRNNSAVYNGGGIFTNRDDDEEDELIFLNISDSRFVRNEANFGGAMEILDAELLSCTDCQFRRNKARDSFAGISVKFSTDVNIRRTEFLENNADSQGAALFLEECHSSQVATSNFTDNESQSTGVFVLLTSHATVTDSTFLRNRGGRGGGVYLENAEMRGRNLVFQENEAESGGALDSNASSPFLCRNCRFIENRADDGGAVFMTSTIPQESIDAGLDPLFENRSVLYQFDDCEFNGNIAEFGAALQLVLSHERGRNCTSFDEGCKYLASRGSRFNNNSAVRAGSILQTTDADASRFQCQSPSTRRLQFMELNEFFQMPRFSPDNLCNEWMGNQLSGEGYGEHVATYAHRVNLTLDYVEDGRLEYITNTSFVLYNQRSGSPLPEIQVTAVDAFESGPASSLRRDLNATMSSPRDDFFPGTLLDEMSNGSARFAEITGFKQPGMYRLYINFTDPSLENVVVDVDIRNCTVNEEAVVRGQLCRTCDTKSYSFGPKQGSDYTCTRCPDNANCSGSLIMPSSGYWHRHPCSTHIHECLSESACRDDDRLATLTGDIESFTQCPNETDVQNYAEHLCNEGHMGVLCGACEPGFGLSSSFECRRCRHNAVSVIIIILTILWLLLLAALAIRGNLYAGRRRQRRNPRFIETMPQTSGDDTSRQEIGAVLSEERSRVSLHREQSALNLSSTSEEALIIRAKIARWKCTEILKVMLNYLQVLGVAITITVNWSEAVYDMLRTADALGGVTASATARSVDCLSSDDGLLPRSVVRTIMDLFVPLLVICIISLFWSLVTIHLAQSFRYWLTRSLLGVVVVMYISYIGITKTLVRIVYCVDVHDSYEPDDDAYSSYWAMDTSLKCYEGDHLALVSFVSVPFLILFSLACPVAYVVLVYRYKIKQTSKSTWVPDTMAFMFRAYNERFVFWESVIMLRKALLSVIVVFAYPLGGTLQGTLAIGVLVVASYAHQICHPFSPDFSELNLYEGLSLLMSSLTFVCGLFFGDGRTSQPVRAFLTVTLLLGNVGLLLFFSLMLLHQTIKFFGADLELEGVAHTKTPQSIVPAYFSHYLGVFFEKIVTSTTANQRYGRN